MEKLRYSFFERGISAVLLAGMAGVILLATGSFLIALWPHLTKPDQQLDYTAFQGLFDRALAALIAIELAHSIHQAVRGHHGLVQVRTVVIIGLLAVVRKFVLLEVETADGVLIAGLGLALLALGIVYALTHWIEDRMRSRLFDDQKTEDVAAASARSAEELGGDLEAHEDRPSASTRGRRSDV
ncbi:MAG: phosphate-starvation-inducible PsiE family protein [Pseudomonadota bacterium]